MKMNKVFIWSMMILCGVLGIFAGATLIAGLSSVGWSIGALMSSYMGALGMTSSFVTLVDYYTYIKGVEYLMAAGFFGVFVVFMKYIEGGKQKELA